MARNPNVSKVITPMPPSGYWPDLLYQSYDKPPCGPGFRMADNLGRSFRLVKTAEAVVAGDALTYNVAQAAIAATKFDADAANATELDIDITVTAQAYQNGFLCLTEGTGLSFMHPISEHSVGTAGTTDSKVKIEGKLNVTLSASDTVGYLMNSPFWNVTKHNQADPCVECPIGVACWATTSSNLYCWAQTWGPILVKADTNGISAGDVIQLGEDNAGRVENQVAAESTAGMGNAIVDIAAGAWGLVILKLFP